MKLDNGLHPQLSRAQYDSLEGRTNWSLLRNIVRSPAHYRHAVTAVHEDSDAMRLGRAVHLAVLEPERFRASIAVWEEGPRRGKAWDAFCVEHRGVEILRQADYETCIAMQAAARADAVAARYLSGGQSEVSVLWAHSTPAQGALPAFNVDCKARPDFVAECGALVDLKTSKDASPDAFGRSAFNLHYHAQAAWYVDGYEAATGIRLPFVLVTVEAGAPHVVTVYRVGEDILQLGRAEYRAALERLNQCRTDARWPGYALPGQELELTLPRWAVANDDQDIAGMDLVIGE